MSARTCKTWASSSKMCSDAPLSLLFRRFRFHLTMSRSLCVRSSSHAPVPSISTEGRTGGGGTGIFVMTCAIRTD